MKEIMRLIVLTVLALCQWHADVAYADAEGLPSWLDNIQFHGFAAQSYLESNHNDFFGESEDGSFDFREIGLNTLWRITPDLQIAVQLLSREAGETDDGDLRFDYAMIDYAVFNTDAGTSGIRIGRIMNPYGFYNDTRDIAATRPSILLPQSVYFDVNRNFALSSDGAQFYSQTSVDSGFYSLQFHVFEPRMNDPDFEPALLFMEAPGRFEGDDSWMARFIYEYDLGRIRLGLTAAQVNAEYHPGRNDFIGAGDFQFQPYLLSFQYNAERWSFTAEYAKRTVEIDRFVIAPDTEFTGTSYFIQGTYRVLDSWELLLRYDDLVWNDDDRNGKKFSAATGLPNYMRFAKDWTTGIRWDVNQYLMLRAEWHKVRGTGWLSLLENPNSLALDEDWDLFAFLVSIRF